MSERGRKLFKASQISISGCSKCVDAARRQTSSESCRELQIAVCTPMTHILDTVLLCVDCSHTVNLLSTPMRVLRGATMSAEVYRLVLC